MIEKEFLDSHCCTCGSSDVDMPLPKPKFALLRSALTFIEAEGCYDGWLWVGAVIHREADGSEDGLRLFNAWSKRHSDYLGAEHVYRTWISFHHDRPWSAELQEFKRELESLGVEWDEVILQSEDPFFWIDVEVEDYA